MSRVGSGAVRLVWRRSWGERGGGLVWVSAMEVVEVAAVGYVLEVDQSRYFIITCGA